MKCQDCKYVNRTFDFCLDIVLNIDRDKPKIVEPKKKKKKSSLQEIPPEEAEKPEESAQEKAQQEEEKVADAPMKPRYNQVDPSELKDANIPYFDKNLYDLYEPNIDEITKNIGKDNSGDTVNIS